jgi:hypothetical protein
MPAYHAPPHAHLKESPCPALMTLALKSGTLVGCYVIVAASLLHAAAYCTRQAGWGRVWGTSKPKGSAHWHRKRKGSWGSTNDFLAFISEARLIEIGVSVAFG